MAIFVQRPTIIFFVGFFLLFLFLAKRKFKWQFLCGYKFKIFLISLDIENNKNWWYVNQLCESEYSLRYTKKKLSYIIIGRNFIIVIMLSCQDFIIYTFFTGFFIVLVSLEFDGNIVWLFFFCLFVDFIDYFTIQIYTLFCK